MNRKQFIKKIIQSVVALPFVGSVVKPLVESKEPQTVIDLPSKESFIIEDYGQPGEVPEDAIGDPLVNENLDIICDLTPYWFGKKVDYRDINWKEDLKRMSPTQLENLKKNFPRKYERHTK